MHISKWRNPGKPGLRHDCYLLRILDFRPLSRDGEGELAVRIGFDRRWAVEAQVVEVVAELEL